MSFLEIISIIISIAFWLFVIGAVIKSYVVLPKQIRELESRLRKLENKEEK